VIGPLPQGPAYKGAPLEFNDYRNYWEAVDRSAGGDMAPLTASNPDVPASGEFNFTHFKATGSGLNDWSLQLNQQGTAARLWAYRCTFEGRPPIFLAVGLGDGPLGITDSVVINAGTFSFNDFAEWNGTDSSPITFEASLTPTGTDNLAGTTANNIVDANGLLQGGFRTAYLGLKGHEIAEAEEPPPEVPSVGGPAFACGGIF
jgi:hypothetical protein